MKTTSLTALSILSLLSACSSAAVPQRGSPSPGVQVSPAEQGSSEGTEPTNEIGTAPEPLIEATVSGIFPADGSSQCAPFAVPITQFLTDAFGVEALVRDDTTPTSESECLHEQVLAAPANAWAALAYTVICRGGGDPNLCGALTTRQCSVDLLTEWAAERDVTVSTSEPTFGFAIAVPPLDEPAREALGHRAEDENRTLLSETIVVSTLRRVPKRRNCPGEEL